MRCAWHSYIGWEFRVATYTATVSQVHELLKPELGTSLSRKAKFTRLATKFLSSLDPTYRHMGTTMRSFCKELFAGNDDAQLPADNLGKRCTEPVATVLDIPSTGCPSVSGQSATDSGSAFGGISILHTLTDPLVLLYRWDRFFGSIVEGA